MSKKKTENTVSAVNAVEVAESLVWSSAEDGRKAAQLLTSQCESTVPALVAQLKECNDDATVKASFALEAMVMATMQPGKEKEASKIAKALAKALPKANDDTARCILLKYLDLLCIEDTIPAIKAYLKEEPTFTYATMALRHLGNEEAYNAILAAAEQCKDAKKKAILVAAALQIAPVREADWDVPMFQMEQEYDSSDAEDMAIKLLKKGDFSPIARMLWKELARHGNEELIPFLEAGLQAPSRIVRGDARAALAVHFAVSDSGQAGLLLKNDQIKEPWLFMNFLLHFVDEEDFVTLCGMFVNGDKIQRAHIAEILQQDFLESHCSELLVGFAALLEKPELKADMLLCLGRRKDLIARPFIMSCLNDKSPEVRAAALEAARMLPGDNVSAATLAGIVKAAF